MIKCRRRQATDPQKLKNSQQSFSRILLVEAEAVGVETVDEMAASASLLAMLTKNPDTNYR